MVQEKSSLHRPPSDARGFTGGSPEFSQFYQRWTMFRLLAAGAALFSKGQMGPVQM